MQIIPFPNIYAKTADYVIDGLLHKQESVILSGSNTLLFAVQAACDVANEKSFLETFPTASENIVLFVTKDQARFGALVQPLARRIQKTPNARLVVLNQFNDEHSLLAKIDSERPALTVVDYGAASNTCLGALARLTSVVALADGDLTGNPIKSLWILYTADGFYWLKARSREKLLKLSKLENGFVLESVEELPPPERPVWNTAKSSIVKNSAVIGSGIHGLSGGEQTSLIPIR